MKPKTKKIFACVLLTIMLTNMISMAQKTSTYTDPGNDFNDALELFRSVK